MTTISPQKLAWLSILLVHRALAAPPPSPPKPCDDIYEPYACPHIPERVQKIIEALEDEAQAKSIFTETEMAIVDVTIRDGTGVTQADLDKLDEQLRAASELDLDKLLRHGGLSDPAAAAHQFLAHLNETGDLAALQKNARDLVGVLGKELVADGVGVESRYKHPIKGKEKEIDILRDQIRYARVAGVVKTIVYHAIIIGVTAACVVM